MLVLPFVLIKNVFSLRFLLEYYYLFGLLFIQYTVIEILILVLMLRDIMEEIIFFLLCMFFVSEST